MAHARARACVRAWLTEQHAIHAAAHELIIWRRDHPGSSRLLLGGGGGGRVHPDLAREVDALGQRLWEDASIPLPPEVGPNGPWEGRALIGPWESRALSGLIGNTVQFSCMTGHILTICMAAAAAAANVVVVVEDDDGSIAPLLLLLSMCT